MKSKIIYIIRKIMEISVRKSMYMNKNRDYKKYDIGDWTYGFPHIFLGRTHGNLKIGKFCSIGPNVEILLVNDHRSDWVTTYPFSVLFQDATKNIDGYPRQRGNLIIGNDVWIGYGATIISGVTIGNGAVIGAKTMVNTDVPPYAIVAGNPGKVVKYRFSKEIISRLEGIRWWDWPIEKINKAIPLLLQEDIEDFCKKYEV